MRYFSNILIISMLFITLNTCVTTVPTPDPLTVKNLDKEIVDAISKDNYDYVNQKIKGGLNVNTRDKDGLTYLHRAAFLGAKKVMELLLKAGALVNATDNKGETALITICSTTTFLSKLRDISPTFNLYYPEVKPESITAIIRLLLKYHADPDITCNSFGSPLHSIAARGKTEQCELLLNAGANIDLCVTEHDTPLFMAVLTRNINNIRYLIKKGANVNLGEKYCPLMYTAVQNDLEIGKMLIDAGADVNYCYLGKTALSYARKYGNVEFAKMLLANGAQENNQEEEKQSVSS